MKVYIGIDPGQPVRGGQNLVDLTGQRFGEWEVLARDTNDGGIARWRCRCSCGNERVVRGTDLRNGSSQRCRGCSFKTPAGRAAQGHRTRTHGVSRSGEYASLSGARRRCENPLDKDYRNYGERGVEYRLPDDLGATCAALIDAIGPRPLGMSIDRIDNDGHYEIGNLRWATPAQQRANQRSDK